MSFFCLLPPGKPDPYHAPEGTETRKRVSYQGQKGKTCWYYGFKLLINDRAAPKAKEGQQRIHEKALSALRKQFTQLSLEYETSEQLASKFVIDPQNRALSLISLLGAVERQAEDADIRKNLFPRVGEFVSQVEIETFDQYVKVQWAKDSIKIYKSYLSHYGTLAPLEGDPIPQSRVLHGTLIHTISKIYGCKSAVWNPSDGRDVLLQQLKEKGAHLINAQIGRGIYLNEPKQLSETVEGRNVYGWPQGSSRRQGLESHFVVLVGIKKEAGDKYFVYFVDPLDPSEPGKPETQKIYKVSYERVIGVIANIVGVPFALRAQHSLNYPYAVHM